MPIIIKEKDKTTVGKREYSNFTVVVPGFVNTDNKAKWGDKNPFDENNIFECSSQKDFIDQIGKVAPVIQVAAKVSSKKGETEAVAVEETTEIKHFGNQIAYELLGLGYTVLYYNLGEASAENLKKLDEIDWCLPLADKSVYDFRYIVNGLLNNNAKANTVISTLAALTYEKTENGEPGNPAYIGQPEYHLTGRGDCTALIDIDEDIYLSSTSTVTSMSDIIKKIQDETNKYCSNFDSDETKEETEKYMAIFVPSVSYKGINQDVYNNSKFPASFHYLACAAASANKNFAEWYAVSGYTRGTTPNYTIESTSIKLGEAAINALQPRQAQVFEESTFDKSVNIIAKMKKNYYLWGNRTAYTLKKGDLVASHFLNIRQLCSTIKKQAYVACKRFTFDPNSDVLWINLTSTLIPMLERMKADQGIEDYKLIKLTTDKKATLKALIRIIPVEAVEDFDITLSLEDSFEDRRN